jgi:hypothetical protein
MKLLRNLTVTVIALSTLAFGTSFLVENNFASRAVLTQRIQENAGSALFDDNNEKGDTVGSPQPMIIDDPKAVISERSGDKPRLVSQKYLDEHKIYPLQLQTVKAIASMVRVGAVGALVVALALFLWLRSRLAKTSRE